MTDPFLAEAPDREHIDATPGLQVVVFGTNWCGHCQAGLPAIQQALATQPQVQVHWVEDGPGRRLGRTFKVKLWPTVIVMRDGVETGRVVRPTQTEEVTKILTT